MSQNKSDKEAGFTLVEMLAIAPVAILIIGGFIALMVTMVGDIMVNNGRNIMTHDIQTALNMIEQDVRVSTEFQSTSGTMLTPQGKNDTTSAFTSTSGDLILRRVATDKNPLDPSHSLVYYNSPQSCSSKDVYKNDPYLIHVIYFVKESTLWRRTYLPNPAGTLCQTAWQVNSCSVGYTNTTRCKTNDTEVIRNVESFTVSYYTEPQDTTSLTSSNAPSAKAIDVTINGKQSTAGRDIQATATVRVVKSVN